jgi:hypothetical protein
LLIISFSITAIVSGCREQTTEIPATPSNYSLKKFQDLTSENMGQMQILKNDSNAIRRKLIEVNSAIEKTALMLAEAMKDKETRRLIKEEVSKRFDGDYEVLFKTIGERRHSDGKSFLDKMTEGHKTAAQRSGRSISDADAVDQSLSLIASVPLFQIGVPYYVIDKWNPDTQIPLVICLPDGMDKGKKEVKQFKAVDSDGNIKWIDVDAYLKNPYPVVVLGVNERIDENGKLREGMTTTQPVKQDKSVNQSDEMKLSSTHALVVKNIYFSPFAFFVNSWPEDLLSAGEFFAVVNMGGNEAWTSFEDWGRQAAWSYAGGLNLGYIPINRTIYYGNSNQAVNVDFVEVDYILWWRNWAFVDDRWFSNINRIGPELDVFPYSFMEAYYYGKEGRINFSARWE